MEVGLIDVDSHNFPNLALMKISQYHKRCGDRVEFWNGLKHYDVVYKSKVFDKTYTDDMDYCIMADHIERGGVRVRPKKNVTGRDRAYLPGL